MPCTQTGRFSTGLRVLSCPRCHNQKHHSMPRDGIVFQGKYTDTLDTRPHHNVTMHEKLPSTTVTFASPVSDDVGKIAINHSHLNITSELMTSKIIKTNHAQQDRSYDRSFGEGFGSGSAVGYESHTSSKLSVSTWAGFCQGRVRHRRQLYPSTKNGE